MSRRGYTLFELLAVIFVMSVPIMIGKSVGSAYGAAWGIRAGFLAIPLSVITVILLYRWSWRREDRKLQELR
jgi:prepilin-type N-terminal cleavage/methylation domain-containing protein